MEVNDNELRKIVNNLVLKKGLEGAIAYISTGEYSKELKNRALSMLEQKKVDNSALGENGDISDLDI